jgi:hypothetical protein
MKQGVRFCAHSWVLALRAESDEPYLSLLNSPAALAVLNEIEYVNFAKKDEKVTVLMQLVSAQNVPTERLCDYFRRIPARFLSTELLEHSMLVGAYDVAHVLHEERGLRYKTGGLALAHCIPLDHQVQLEFSMHYPKFEQFGRWPERKALMQHRRNAAKRVAVVLLGLKRQRGRPDLYRNKDVLERIARDIMRYEMCLHPAWGYPETSVFVQLAQTIKGVYEFYYNFFTWDGVKE